MTIFVRYALAKYFSPEVFTHICTKTNNMGSYIGKGIVIGKMQLHSLSYAQHIG